MTVIRLTLVLFIFQTSCTLKKNLSPERVRYENQLEAILTYFDQLHEDCQPNCIYNVSPNINDIESYELDVKSKWLISPNEIKYDDFSLDSRNISYDFGTLKVYEHLDSKYTFSSLVISENGRELAFFVKPPNHYLHFVLFSRIGNELVIISDSVL